MAENIGFVVAAYAVTWVFLIGYLIRLRGVTRRARAEFAEATRAAGEQRS